MNSEMNTKSSTKADAQQVWLITGTSRGFGAEIAKSALAAGDIVAGTARRPEDVTKSLGKSDRLLAVKMDVTDPESVRAGVETVIAQFGRIDVLVNNAG
jgi:NAD(P)-dependent dehydrogenase (short-subunit alcohol dehydrogenase family)